MAGTIDFLVNIVGVENLLLGAAAIIAFFQLRHMDDTNKQENKRRMKEYALTYSLTRKPEAMESRVLLNDLFGPTTATCERIPIDTIQAAFVADPKVRSALRMLLNHWENLALAVYNGVADEQTAYEMVSSRLTNTVRQYGDYIDTVMAETPLSYKYLKWLSEHWEKRLGNSPNGQPLRKP